MQNGDWILIDYTARRASDGRVVETTHEAEAKKAGFYDEKITYEPNVVIVGEHTTLPGLEEALITMKVGDNRKVEIEPAKGFGPRDPALVRVISVGEFRRRDIDPKPGMVLDFDGRKGLVRSVTSGRVTVDLNHPLAGERLTYDVKVVESLQDTAKKAQALLSASLQVKGGAAATSASFKDGTLEMTFGEALAKDMSFIIGKTEFVGNVLRLMPEVKLLRVVEEYARKAEGGAKEGHSHAEGHEGHAHSAEGHAHEHEKK
ncbi:Putative FKBP-type peptidyl-prolyl cis-trans isomerase [Candidatus Burarchaeum australiense]|nr:Putative FKBP-type peptidyl-prolyl cis-trans isomerase [Candidatus Burarchaeum australiense]